MKKIIISLILVVFLITPVFVSAQAAQTQTQLTQQLIQLLTKMIAQLEQEIQQILAQQHTPTPTPNPTQSTTISSCQDISKPGNYTLSGDIINTASIPCINVHDTSNVNLDCQNHSVTSSGENYAIYFNNVNNFSVNNCTVQPVAINSSATQVPMRLFNSSNGAISNLNAFGGSGDEMAISNSTNITVSGSTFMGLQYQVYKSSYVNTENNTFSATVAQGGVVVSLQGGNNNSVVNNNIDGMSDGIFHGYGATDNIGIDDDIVITDEKSDLISGNNLKNNWDCGIENAGYVYDTQIINNKIDNVGVAGIGGWYYNSMKGNTISGNIITNAPELFLYFRYYDLRPSVESVMYFENNNFTSNTLTSQKTSAKSSTNISIFAPSGKGGGFQFPDFTDQQVVASNNVIKNNNFGTLFSSSFAPSNIFVDGGGNVCSPTSDTDYPINCGGIVLLPTSPGVCGSASGVTTATIPISGLCSAGTASAVSNNTGLGYWMWSCQGAGAPTYCNAPISVTTAINGSCGSAQGTTSTSKPTANLCATGTVLNLVDNTGLNVWMWGCQGANGGTTANCYAND